MNMMFDDQVSWIIAFLEQLIVSQAGDLGRLTAIKHSLENGKIVYDSDKEYLKKMFDEFLENTSEQKEFQESIQKKRNENTVLIKKVENEINELINKTKKLEAELEELEKENNEIASSRHVMTPGVKIWENT